MSAKKRASRENRRSPLAGRIALITGASQGVGLAIARALARAGCRLILTGRNQATLDSAAKQLTVAARDLLTVACDVRKPEQIRALMTEVRRKFRRLDILINNAGVAHAHFDVAKLPIEAWREVIDTNLTGPFLVTQAALPLMNRGAVILNNLSGAAKQAFAGASGYTASKHGALGFTNSLREELRGRGIRVIAALPGAIDTAIWNSFWPDAPRTKMMSANTVAQAMVNALALPADSVVEEISLKPMVGTL